MLSLTDVTLRILQLENMKRDIENQIKDLKNYCERKLEEEDCLKYSDKNYSIIYKQSSTSESVDLRKLENNDNSLYTKLLESYKKVSTRKGAYAWSSR